MFNDFDDDFFKKSNDLSFDDDFFKDTRNKFNDDIFKDFENRHQNRVNHGPDIMDVMIPILIVLGGVSIVISICCYCCKRTKYRGRVLAAGNSGEDGTNTTGPGYPTQPYTATVVTAYPAAQGGSYYPTTAPYPSGAPYPTATPYSVVAPFPPAAPYPTAAPYPQQGTGMPQPNPAPAPMMPMAPPREELPPSYDQIVGGVEVKQAPYNPNYPH